MSEDTKLQQLIINTLSPEQMPEVLSETEIYLVEDDAEYATVEELAGKQDVIPDLGDIRNNIATNTSNISYLDEKVRDIELFKFPNAVIIGEPTISNGQVSGFSADNYMQFPFILDLHNTPFQIDFAFTTDNNVTTQQNILDSEFGLALAIANGKGIMAISGNGTSWNIGSSVGTIAIEPNTTYYARLTWDGMQYKTLISTNGTDYTQDMYLVGTQRPYPRTIFIGGCSGSVIGHTPHPFFGTINMNKSYLSTRGQVIWQGMDDAGLATRADISLSNLDELGNARFDSKLDLTGGTVTGNITVTDEDSGDINIGYGEINIDTGSNKIQFLGADILAEYYNGSVFEVDSGGFHYKTSGNNFYLDHTGVDFNIGDKRIYCQGDDALHIPTPVLDYSTVSDDAALTAKWLKDNAMPLKQDVLVSGTNIKTINNESILGSGNFDVSSIEPLSQEEYDRRKEAGELEEGKYYSTPSDVSLELLEVLYPVGSFFFGIMSVCPLATLGIGTWQIVGTGIISDVASIAPVAGNGMAIGLTNGSNNYGLATTSSNNLAGYTAAYGQSVGGNLNTGSNPSPGNAVGITTDSTKSGIEANIASTKLPVNIFRRIA